mmetsp:Transcript_91713/g.259699  ORF Transcript_91713/g.259699 Transcript_91713/m.259699 type:complete len:316 (-) Transcript_91713:390-1337(-)
MTRPCVMTVSLTTFMQMRTKRLKTSSERPVWPSSSRWAKSLGRPSRSRPGEAAAAFFASAGSAALAAASAFSSWLAKKARNSASSTWPSPLASNSLNRPSVFSSFSFWKCLITARALVSRRSSSCEASFLASARSRFIQFVVLVNLPSKLPIFFSSFLTCVLRKPKSSLTTSRVCSLSTPSRAPARVSLAVLSCSSILAACSSMAGDCATPAPCAGSGRASSSALATSSTVFAMASCTSVACCCISAFTPCTTFSRSSRFSRLFASISFSRSMPIFTFSCWKSFRATPLAPLSMRALRILSRASSGTLKSHSPPA